ncbi:MAG: hypothetical protein JWM80_4887 [Cyanobacteria bacterium RYN_339]|nr:hypothetical protein [Cyanobacteria bacterium RYN_339]
MAIVLAPFLALALAAAKPAPSPKPTPHAPAGAPSPSPTSMPSIAPTPAPRAGLPVVVTGVVRDAQSKEPIGGALIQQEGSVTSVFTQPDGHFRLLMDRTGGGAITVSAVGYENVSTAVGAGKDLDLKLKSVSGFLPNAPLAPLTPVGMSAAETAPLNSGLVFAYSLRNVNAAAPGSNGSASTITGWSNNDFRLGARVRWKPWLVEVEGSHYEVPADVAGLRKEDNPAFKPSTWQAGARLGAIWSVTSDLEGALLGAYRWSNTVPNNSRIPYTGSDLDFEQTRHALGGVALAAWRPGRGRWHLEGSAGYYPLVYAIADSPGTPIAGSSLLEARAILGYEIMPGLRLGLGGGLERWSGTGQDQSVRVTLGVHYTPGGVPKGNE